MKSLFFLLLLFCSMSPLLAQKVDTTYYDQEWQPLKTKAGAEFIGTKQSINDSTVAIKDYYITGQLQNTGCYINGRKKGRWTYYYPDGTVKMDYEYINNGNNRNWFTFNEDELKPNEEGIYHTVNHPAKFRGSAEPPNAYINKNFKLPKKAIKAGFKSFQADFKLTIDESGKVLEAKEMRTLIVRTKEGKYESREMPSKLKLGVDEAFTEFLLAMPNWDPATVKGTPVKSAHILQVHYSGQ